MHETATLHFDLSHLSPDQPFTLHAGSGRYELTRHIVLYHTLTLEPNLFDRALFDGHTYSDKAPGMSFLAVPAFELERATGVAKAPTEWEAKGDLSLWLMRVLTSGVLFLVAVFVVGRLGERLVAGAGAATAAIFGAATLAACSLALLNHDPSPAPSHGARNPRG